MLSAALPEEMLSFEIAELLPLFLRDGGVEDEAKLGLVESAVSTVDLLILLCVLWRRLRKMRDPERPL